MLTSDDIAEVHSDMQGLIEDALFDARRLADEGRPTQAIIRYLEMARAAADKCCPAPTVEDREAEHADQLSDMERDA